jgi:alkylresorcinol/alkylpyrone synthase
MRIARIFSYGDGPWYGAQDALRLLGHSNKLIADRVLKSTEFEKRRLFALNDIGRKPLDDGAFLAAVTKGFSVMARSLVDQFRAWEGDAKKKIRSITVINSQGIPKPGLVEVLKELLGVDEVSSFHVTGLNCGSTFLVLQHLHQLSKRRPLGDGECDLVFSVEVPSASVRIGRSILSLPYFVYDMFVSDGAALAVLESGEGGPGLEVIGHRNFFYPNAQDLLTSRASGNQVEHGLASGVAKDIERTLESAVGAALSSLGLKREQIRHWITHPGGVVIVKAVARVLGLEEQSQRHALDTIRSEGNTMSSLILSVLRRYFEANAFADGDHVMLMGFAPGFEIQTMTLRWVRG